MKVTFLIVFLLAGIFNTNAQKAYIIHDFMKDYTLYFVQQTINSEIKEYYKLTENKSPKTVLEYGAKELSKPQISKTAKTAAFKSISNSNIRILGDVNFDGRPDIIIHDTEKFDEGCYSPIANASIFINTTTDFSYSQTISEVYNGAYCMRGGSFDIDTKNKRLITWSSGGASLHGCEHYSVLGKEAKMVATYQEDGYFPSPYCNITGKKWENNKWVSFTSLSLYEEGLKTNKLLSFDTKNGKGRVILFKADNVLYYAFRKNDEYNFISFAHPSSPEKASKAAFKFRKQNTGYELEFNSGSIKYILYETADNVGIKINVNGKISDWQGIAKKGTLDTLTHNKFINVTNE
ncbi:hypothetical protein L1276_001446 [Flavobacterium sp. HSC-32F16]|uniref:XAC2610-related protein n=1 Tax=Flavobacterium sp. HSC-32F16 TaxID=2910964 RepID=UPI0020A3A829|nr:hypothetical protein [Flavobacterium sp. HSC-32F16]MCP2026302.1 hypothetical protein [Flavobacterium sp. HSC-32F16]